MSRLVPTIAALAAVGLSCATVQWPGVGPGPAVQDPIKLEPLPVQQAKAYPETVTGRFVSLADFEDTPLGPRGAEQVKHFAIEPPPAPGAEGSINYEVNITRTGVGAIEVVLPHGSELAFNLPSMHDFTGYTLISFALYSQAVRDDLVVSLAGGAQTWTAPRTLIEPGWNNVLIDIQPLATAGGFDIRSVDSIRLKFADAVSPVTFNLDDIMAIDNRRAIRPVPAGVTLEKNGLNYSLKLPGRDRPLLIAQGADGLWRLGAEQPIVQLGQVGRILAGRDEMIALMGERRIGRLRLLENNAVRIRVENVWYFPSRQGEWSSMAVRQVRWEHTFYGDGRTVTHMELNNSGGADIGPMRIILAGMGAWAGKDVARELSVSDMRTGVGRWDWLTAPGGDEARAVRQGYLRPGKVRAALAAQGVFAPGDADRDGFDESQGCHVLGAKAGNCRFTILPPPGGLVHGVFRVLGRWDGPVSVNVEGELLGDVVRLSDGSALFVIGGAISRPTAVEVSGKDATPPS
ncbi:MAG: hypothetical protein ACE15C_02535 [Phycisphaerae bacterium]